VLRPLMIPKGLVIALVILPVCAHELQEVGRTERSKDGGNVGVGTRGIAVGIVSPIAAVGPGLC
jgi:hypothetical protein